MGFVVVVWVVSTSAAVALTGLIIRDTVRERRRETALPSGPGTAPPRRSYLSDDE
jgi:hypothetical protein